MFCLPRKAALLIALLGFTPALAEAQAPAPLVQAQSWLLYDRTAGQVLASSNPDIRWEPASLTKLMTAYLVFEAVRDGRLGWQQVVEAPPAVRRVGNEESRMYLMPGNRVSVETLLSALMVISANDAAVTLAHAVDGSEEAFVTRMNAAAARLGMTGTHFNNPSGIPGPTHYTTAEDLLRLTLAFDHDFPQIYAITRQQRFTFRQFRDVSTNPLLTQDASVDGLKTGHTRAAGYNIIISSRRHATPAGGQDRGLIAVVLGAPSKAARAQSSRMLLDYGTNAFQLMDVLTAGQELQRSRIYGSQEGFVALGVEQSQTLALPAGTTSELRVSLDDAAPFAPLPRGAVLGHVEAVSQDGTVLASAPLVTLQEAEPASWPVRLYDRIALLFSHWMG